MKNNIVYSLFLLLVLTVFFLNHNASAQIQIDHTNDYLVSGGNLVPYVMTQNSSSITVLSKQGSFVYNNSTCSLSFYNTTNTGSSPSIPFDNYAVKAELNGTTNWSNVGVINNAQCTTQYFATASSITVQSTKSVAGAGVFQINYTKNIGQSLKLSFKATNKNPAWTNYHIGMTESIGVPRFVTLGNATYDLSLYNSTVLNRSWISSHSGQLISFSSNFWYNMGLGWNNVNQITIHYIHGQAILDIDYTYNTPILQPNQTILVDPSLDVIGTALVASFLSDPANANQTLTVASNPNRLLVIGIGVLDTSSLAEPINAVHIGSNQFTQAVKKQHPTLRTLNTEIWYLSNPPTGSQTITVTFKSGKGTTYYVINSYSLYNVGTSSPIGNSTSNSGTTSGTTSVKITPEFSKSWIIDENWLQANPTASLSSLNGTQAWNGSPTSSSASSSQYVQNPTASKQSTMSWTIGGASPWNWIATSVEINNTPLPAAPTLNSITQISPSSLNASWSTSSGATWYLENRTSPSGGTLVNVVNTTSLFHVDTGLAAGTQYQYGIQAGNTTGFGSVSNKLSRYTVNIAPTIPSLSQITFSSMRLSWTNPSGNFSGFKIEKESPIGGGWSTVISNTNNSTNRYDLTGLAGNIQYNFRVSTNYATGSSDAGTSSPSITTASYTLPVTPNGLAVSQSLANILHLSWSTPSDNGTVLGYKIERSVDFGISWIVLVANTGNTAIFYDDSGLTTGNTYTYRISVIKLGGTSLPTSPVSHVVLSSIQLNPTGINVFNSTVLSFSYTTLVRNSSSFDIFPLLTYNPTTQGQTMSFYHGIAGTNTLTKKFGTGLNTLTLSCNLVTAPMVYITTNSTFIYYLCANAAHHIDINTGVIYNDFSVNYGGTDTQIALFMAQKQLVLISGAGNSPYIATLAGGNVSSAYAGGLIQSNQAVLGGFKYNWNGTNIGTIGTICDINYNPTNTTTALDSIGCDKATPAMAIKYLNGMLIRKVAGTNTNNTQNFINSIDTNPYKKILSLPCVVFGVASPCLTFIATDSTTSINYLVILTANKIYYTNANTALTLVTNNNYALQSYLITPLADTTNYIPNPLLQSIKIYGPAINSTVSTSGLITIPSGYYIKGASTPESVIRTVDPRWTNDQTDIPAIVTTGTLFPIYLTVSNAPTNAALMVTNPAIITNNIASVWTVTALDATRSAEFDIPANQCGLVYITDISQSPSIWNYEGQICATGANQKTIAYTNTLPQSFYVLKYGVTSSFTPQTNGLSTSFRSTTPGTTYTVTINNSTGVAAQTYTFTVPPNVAVDTHNYNVSSVSKPASLSVSVAGNQIYTAYLGSSVSLSSVASFFHQYLNYQGFDFLSFIPVIFAAMFTRNTVGVGMAMVVLCIATLSWLSVVVVPEPAVYVSIFIAVVGMIGYRAFGY